MTTASAYAFENISERKTRFSRTATAMLHVSADSTPPWEHPCVASASTLALRLDMVRVLH